MKKVFKWILDNILFLATLFLLSFIPLYPKLPLFDVVNTWVYVRAEDFVVVFVFLIWIVLFLRKKITLKTPLTMPIIIFWIIGAIATLHGVLLIFPTLSNVFPNVAFLSYLRHIEYLSLFFIGYAGMRDKKFLPYVVAVLTITLFLVFFYGIGQKYLGFSAYLTMNEEFAKGIPIQLSQLSRVPSTFAGHYDLAAYLVFIIPLLVSIVFGVRNWIVRGLLLLAASCGFVLLFMTVSRVSFFVLFIGLALVLLLQKKKFIILSLPIIAVVILIVFLRFSPSLVDRFGNTVKQIDVLVDARTGEPIGHVEIVSSSYFDNKVIKRKVFQNSYQVNSLRPEKMDPEADLVSTASAASLIFPNHALPSKVILVSPPNASTGENLPQGTGYVNLSLSPVTKRLGEFFYDYQPGIPLSDSASVFRLEGDFLIKKALAYDLSFTTRYQGEWPHALDAFKRNILIGSGYSSVSLAVDNNYLRILGEIGLLGFLSFFAIFVAAGIYIRKALPEIDSPLTKSFVLGFVAGVLGLCLNAFLIDVFDASKIAFLLWLITGIVLGALSFYQTKHIDLYKEFKNIFASPYAIVLYLCVIAIMLFSPMVSNYFVGDDFTWFRWAADCGNKSATEGVCPNLVDTVSGYFTQADGFFYRPGTKVYFLLMYSVFWLNQTAYHIVSIFLHFIVAALLFLLANKVIKDKLLSALAGVLFLILSGYAESVFWISSTGHIINAIFILLSLLFFITWDEKKKPLYFILSFVSFVLSLLFHELGIITPLLMIIYKFSIEDLKFDVKQIFSKSYVVLFIVPVIFYLSARLAAGSHWFNGDYSYNLFKLPLNFIGNAIGYIVLGIMGQASLSFYELIRSGSRENMLVMVVLIFIIAGIIILFFVRVDLRRVIYSYIRKIDKKDQGIIIFGSLFFIITLLPFLGLGNITSRYSYLASGGLIILLVFGIKKLYYYLLNNGRDIAFAVTSIVLIVFCLLHVIQIQQLHSDWYEAGRKSERFFVAIDRLYANDWVKEPLSFYFVNVPIRHGAAWVFPVGLSDALWFPLQNDDIKVYQTTDREFAIIQASTSSTSRVFEFKEDGMVEEIIKPKTLQQ